MYTTQNTTKNPIRLWQLPNTLAGDAGVTTIIQSIITWLIERLVVNMDLRKGAVQPIGFVAEPTSRWLRWFMMMDERIPKDHGSDLALPTKAKRLVMLLLAQVLRAFIVAVLGFAVLFGPTVGVLMSVGTKSGGDWVFDAKWVPELFKLILGGGLGLLTTPFMAMFWLLRCGWALKMETEETSDEEV